MKVQRYIIIFLLLGFGISTNAQNAEADLIGTWAFDYEASASKMESTVKTRIDSMPAERRAKIESNYRGRSLTFNADGSFSLSLADGRGYTGTWGLDSGSNTLTMTTPRGTVDSHKIKSLTGGNLVLRPETDGRKGKPMIPEWHYNKN